MHRYLVIITLCFSLSVIGQEVQLSWKKDFNVATELAKSENKKILVFFTKTDCSACLQFYTDFFKQEAFKNLSNDFILLMLDGSNNDIKDTDINVIKQRRLVNHLNKSSTFPAVLALNGEGQEVGELFISTDETTIMTYLNFLETVK